MKTANILIVEDDVWLAEQYDRLLTKSGYKVYTALHPLAAIEMIDIIDGPIAVMILDVLLTGSTAFALMHELRSYKDTSDIPIILCTNLAKELSMDNLKPYGVMTLLDKVEIKPSDLVRSVQELIHEND
ncbi:response regulator [Candidatus Saccharibacteria bacterium]|nr:response regulator [Candidatus Saccharibacteria bacterium]